MSGKGNDNDERADDGDRAGGSRPGHREDPIPDSTEDPNLGEVYGDRYRLDEQIGVGGMGVVYRATHLGLERDVVVKLLARDRLDDRAAVQRFEREARTLGRLDHPHIVTVYDVGTREDVRYIVMEYVDGEQLDEFVDRRGPLAARSFFPIAAQILDAVGQAHREELVHRDLKPSNIMLVARGDRPPLVKILDFGLAKLVSGEDDVTREDSLVGSMPYLSPEQIRGDEIDQRVDVYSLGILFYYALAGRKPFRGSNASILRDQVHSEPPPLRLHVPDPGALPDELFELVDRCLQKDPADRFPDAAAALARLEAIAGRHTDARMPETSPPADASRAPAGPGSASEQDASSSELLGKTSDTSDHVELRRRRSTPESPRPPDADPTHTVADPPTDTDKPPASSETQPRRVGVAVTVVCSLVVLAAAGYWFAPASWTDPADSEPTPIPPESTDQEATDPPSDDGPPQMVVDQLEQVDELASKDRVDAAETLLVTVISTYDDADEIDERISARQRTIHLTREYLKARRAKDRDEIGEAIDILERLVDRAPDFRDARQRLDRLQRLARIRIDATDGAEVRLDDEQIDDSPTTTWVEPGRYEITIDPDERDPWSTSLAVDPGEAVSLEPDLE